MKYIFSKTITTNMMRMVALVSVIVAVISGFFYLNDIWSVTASIADLVIAGAKATSAVFVIAIIYARLRKKIAILASIDTILAWIAILSWGISCYFRFVIKALSADSILIIIHNTLYIVFLIGAVMMWVSLEWLAMVLYRSALLISVMLLIVLNMMLIVFCTNNVKIDFMIFGIYCLFIPLLILGRALFTYDREKVNKLRCERAFDCDEQKRKRWINNLTIMLFFSIVISTLYYFNREATDLEGIDAYCALLMSEGKMVYKDFFFYVPPFYLFRQYLVWDIFDGAILAIRLIGIAERACLFCLIFRLLTQWFKPTFTYIACLLGFAFYNSNAFNSYGDYTQTCQVLLIIAVYLATYFCIDIKHGKVKAAYWKLFGAGLFATQSLMCKQSIGLVALAFLFMTLLVFCFANTEGKRTWKWIGCVLLSFFVLLLPYLIWLVTNGALMDFMNQIFISSLNSKGIVVENSSTETSTLMRVFNRVVNVKSAILWALSLLAILFKTLSYREKKYQKYCRIAFYGMITAIMVLFVVRLQSEASYFTQLYKLIDYILKNLNSGRWILLAGVISLFAWLKSRKDELKRGHESFVVVAISIVFFVSWFWVTDFPSSKITELLQSSNTDDAFALFYEFAFHICIIFFVSHVIQRIVGLQNTMGEECWYYLAAAAANAVVSLMGGGTASFACNGALFTLPFAICLCLNLADHLFKGNSNVEINVVWIRFKNGTMIAAYLLPLILVSNVMLITMAQKINCVYSFHGWTAEQITDTNAYEIDLERYDGMLVSKRTKQTLEQVTKLVEENSNEDDFVWSFPATKIYNILANRIEQPTFATTYFFDTCSDELAISDLEILEENMPVIIIWKELPESSWTFYEENYRNGTELGQREIQRWFESVKDTEYTLIGNVYNEYVYLRNDKTPVYTYYSDGMDCIGNLNEVKDNVPRMRLIEGFYSNVALLFGNFDAYMITDVIRLILIIVAIAMLLSGFPAWKVTSMCLLAAAATHEASWVFAFAFVFPFIYTLNENNSKSKKECVECTLMLIIVLAACMQWSDLWTIIKICIAIPAINILSVVMIIDGVNCVYHKNIKHIHKVQYVDDTIR